MRIYLPATLPMLRRAVESGEFRPVRGLGFAVTSALEQEYSGADMEDLEYIAMHDAALASLRLIASDEADPVRVVVAVDMGDQSVSASPSEFNGAPPPRHHDAAEPGAGHPVERGDLDRAAVRVSGGVDWESVASVHLDGGDVADVIRKAAAAVLAADLGDLDAAVTVGDAEDIDLGWYAPSEIGYLVREFGSS